MGYLIAAAAIALLAVPAHADRMASQTKALLPDHKHHASSVFAAT